MSAAGFQLQAGFAGLEGLAGATVALISLANWQQDNPSSSLSQDFPAGLLKFNSPA